MHTGEMILVTGACGQFGSELVGALRLKYGRESVVATDVLGITETVRIDGPYFRLDARDRYELEKLADSLAVTQIYHLAGGFSVPVKNDLFSTWDFNMASLLNVLEIARSYKLKKVFWPSSNAVFGQDFPNSVYPQHARTCPATIFGIAKCAGEYWCEYYSRNYSVDVRSLRFPDLIGSSSASGAGVAGFVTDLFHQASRNAEYKCCLPPGIRLPMIYMADAVRATLELMDAQGGLLSVRTAYNIAGLSFTTKELAAELQKHMPEFRISYSPDNPQPMAETWPASVDDSCARHDWGWRPQYDLRALTEDLLQQMGEPELK